MKYSVIPAKAEIHASTATQRQSMDSRLRGSDRSTILIPVSHANPLTSFSFLPMFWPCVTIPVR